MYQYIVDMRVPVHPVPLALPSPLKPDGHVQVKLPTVLTQVASSTQSSVPIVHSMISEIKTKRNTCVYILYKLFS